MFAAADRSELSKPELYRELAQQLRSLTDGESDAIANMANCAALIFHSVPRLNWAGFYLLKNNELVVGPFQGKPACVRIPLGRGVCGIAAAEGRILRVANVDEFADHIVCDSASKSEIVLPLIAPDGRLRAVLDLDSPEVGRFDGEDETGLAVIAEIIAAKL